MPVPSAARAATLAKTSSATPTPTPALLRHSRRTRLSRFISPPMARLRLLRRFPTHPRLRFTPQAPLCLQPLTTECQGHYPGCSTPTSDPFPQRHGSVMLGHWELELGVSLVFGV